MTHTPMIEDMSRRPGNVLSRWVPAAAWAASRAAAGIIAGGSLAVGTSAALTAGGFPRGIAVVCGTLLLAIVLHELAHLGTARLLGVPVAVIHIGGPPALVSIPLGSTKLGLGIRLRGNVQLGQHPRAGRRALLVAAGPLANLATAAVVLALPLPGWVIWTVAPISAGLGLANLVPFRQRDGRISDGATLLRLPAQRRAEKDLDRLLASPDWPGQADAADRLLAGWHRKAPDALNRFHYIAFLLRKNGQAGELLELHASDFRLSGNPAEDTVTALHQLEWAVLTLPGLPQPAADLAAQRVEWVAAHCSAGLLPAVQHTLALARLRQHRFAEVEPLCAAALADPLTADQRATVLATVAMARHALGQDSQAPLAGALAQDPAAELVSEAEQVAGNPVPLGQAGG